MSILNYQLQKVFHLFLQYRLGDLQPSWCSSSRVFTLGIRFIDTKILTIVSFMPFKYSCNFPSQSLSTSAQEPGFPGSSVSRHYLQNTCNKRIQFTKHQNQQIEFLLADRFITAVIDIRCIGSSRYLVSSSSELSVTLLILAFSLRMPTFFLLLTNVQKCNASINKYQLARA